MSRADRLTYPVAIGLAEGGWVTVLYLLVDAVARVHPPLGLIPFALAAAAACLAADRLDRLAADRVVVIVALLVGGGVIGVLASALVGAVVGPAAGIGPAADPGSILVGLAALRGFIRAGAMRDADEASRSFFLGLIGLALMWVVGGVLVEPMRAAFRDAAIAPTLAFVVGGVAATGLARSELAAAGAGFDPRSNRSWLVALIGLALVLGIVALPLGTLSERLMAGIIAWPPALPLLIFGAIVARLLVPSRASLLRRAGTYSLGPLIALGVLAAAAILLPPAKPITGGEAGGGGTVDTTEPSTPIVDVALAVLAIALVAGVLLYLARAWRANAAAAARPGGGDQRSRPRDVSDTDDEGGWGLARRLRALTRRGRPTDAVTAYLATLRALEPLEGLGRASGETPAAHARRLHEAGAGSLELDLLAADFELVRWGARSISPAEDRRAIRRWERLRTRLADDSLER
jgi:hypothetical protein